MDALKKIREKIDGPLVVLAGAGTGKTYAIVEKISHLIKEKIFRPEQIVCITFSNEAANNLVTRVSNRFEFEKGKEPIIRTFHGFSADLLRLHGGKIGISESFKILEPDEAKIVLNRSLKIQPYFCHKYIAAIGTAKDLGISIETLKTYLNKTSDSFEDIDIKKRLEDLQFELQTLHLKQEKDKRSNLLNSIKKYSSYLDLKKFCSAWAAYEKIKVKSNYLDYSDLNTLALNLLKNHKEVSEAYEYIVVDEFQDTNKVQLDFLENLAFKGRIMIVGDLNQSIYRFRGAYKDNFQVFQSRFNVNNNEVIHLDRSRRSPNKVLRAAHKLITHNYENIEECFPVFNFEDREGEEIEVYEYKDGGEEARKVTELVEKELKSGIPPEEICILFRTHQQGRAFRLALEAAQIPFISVSKTHLLSQKEIKIVINYLQIIEKLFKNKRGGEQAWWDLLYHLDFAESDLMVMGKFIREHKSDEHLSELIFKSLENFPLSEKGKFSAKILRERISTMLSLDQKDISSFVKEVLKIAGFLGEVHNDLQKEAFLNLSKFLEVVKRHSELYYSDLYSFLNYLEVLGSLGIEIPSAELSGLGVRLMTHHATKGLEYNTVIVTNLAQKRFPIEKVELNSLLPLELSPEFGRISHLEAEILQEAYYDYERKHQLLEERRLCYVAFTRAKKKLILTCAKEYANKKFAPSQFLNELDYKNNKDILYRIDDSESPKPTFKNLEKKAPSLYFNSIKRSGEDAIQNSPQSTTQPSTAKQKVFSPSALLTFIECQKKYEYKYIFLMPDRKTISWEAMQLGSFVHQVLETGVKRNYRDIKDFIDYARVEGLKNEWASVNLEEVLPLLKVFFERNKDKYNIDSKTEQELRAKIGDFQFIGFADRIDYHKEGIEIIDYKTGNSAIAPLHRNWQLGYYALAAANLGKVRKITLDMLKQEKPLEFEVDDQGNAHSIHSSRMEFNIYDIKQELIETAQSVVDASEKGFKPCPVEKNCEFCNEYVYRL